MCVCAGEHFCPPSLTGRGTDICSAHSPPPSLPPFSQAYRVAKETGTSCSAAVCVGRVKERERGGRTRLEKQRKQEREGGEKERERVTDGDDIKNKYVESGSDLRGDCHRHDDGSLITHRHTYKSQIGRAHV